MRLREPSSGELRARLQRVVDGIHLMAPCRCRLEQLSWTLVIHGRRGLKSALENFVARKVIGPGRAISTEEEGRRPELNLLHMGDQDSAKCEGDQDVEFLRQHPRCTPCDERLDNSIFRELVVGVRSKSSQDVLVVCHRSAQRYCRSAAAARGA